MEAGITGGPQVSGYDSAVEKSTKLWRHPDDFSGVVGYPTWRAEAAGGAHITATTDSEGMP